MVAIERRSAFTKEETLHLEARENFSRRLRTLKNTFECPDDVTIFYIPDPNGDDDIAPGDRFKIGNLREAFHRVAVSLRLDAIDLAMDNQREYDNLLKGNLGPAPKEDMENGIDSDGHAMSSVSPYAFVCRLHKPPLIRYTKPL